jgi:hypothetical protein
MKKAAALGVTLFFNFIVILALVSTASGQSASGGEAYFDSGFVVRGEFLDFYNRHGGLRTFGYPLTVAFEENGRHVQYFQAGRMELHPDNPPDRRVMMGTIGEELAALEPPLPESSVLPAARFFPETGHTVAAAFLRYFDTLGGVRFFGYPITGMMSEQGYIVQYFQRARLEWHPKNPPSLRIQLGDLGEDYVNNLGIPPGVGVRDPATDEGYRPDQLSPKVTALEPDALVSHPYVGQNQPQTLYVFVYDQDGDPQPGAEVRVVIRFPQGDQELALPATNDLGVSWTVFDTGQVPMGETVVIDVTVRYGDLQETTHASFVIWL